MGGELANVVARCGRRGLAIVAAATAALALLGSDPAGAAEPPNFVHILTDDQTIDSLEHMASTRSLIARKGTRFTNHHAVQPLCCPSRASFLTGQYPHNHGVLDNLPPFGYDSLDFDRTLYTSLDAAGYRTGWIGKVLNDPDSHGIEPEPGFDEWLVPLATSELDMRDYTVSDNGQVREIDDVYQSDFYASRAGEFLRSPSPDPFMLTLALPSPHWTRCEVGPIVRCAPEPDYEDFGTFGFESFPFGGDRTIDPTVRGVADLYWQRELESLQTVDRIVAEIVSLLRQSGEFQNTYLIFQSDNGMLHGEHGVFDKNVPWDRSVRIPLLIRGPGFDQGEVRSDLTANVDVPATILDAAGIQPPRRPDGYSLLGDHRRDVLLLERTHGLRGPSASQPWLQIKTADGWTYWRELISGRRYLFDLERDPYQLHNRTRRNPELARRLNRRLNRIADCAAPCP